MKVELNGEDHLGVLLYYAERRIITNFLEEYKYELTIRLKNLIDGLPVICQTLSSQSWFNGPSRTHLSLVSVKGRG